MPDLLLSLVVPNDIVQDIEDLLLSRHDLVAGFTANPIDSHGSAVPLVEAIELVSGHSPRTHIRMVASESSLRAILAEIKTTLPHANLSYWLLPVIEAGHL